MTLATLVVGATAQQREAAIADALDSAQTTALILEGLPDARSPLAAIDGLQIARIAPGCVCCSGNLTMRVTLNRLLRQRPQRLFISLATSAHLEAIRRFLTDTPYNDWLQLTQDLLA